ncbi:amidohydrolase family protein [uncultured Ramlibacter sp.]|uniref:N-acyl-D-amino-acid deacylase family protein n=1 Tax=uncultured Ramlibacter sp. TaxID=260755 RepID=UPI002629114B|nr:D-aminoacylase [uncultured Ramlibacter sp.]
MLRGGEVIDGSGAVRFAADVVVEQGRIAAITPPGEGRADRILQIDGRVVCPGFIDSHSHDDVQVLRQTLAQPKLSQGVCTVVTGNCGISLPPLATDSPPAPLDILGKDAYRFSRFADYARAIDEARPCVNVVPLVGHISIRIKHVPDLTRSASEGETRAMRGEVEAALAAGAFGLSTGVYYPPARAANTEELLGVCAALKGRNAILAMHIRDEADAVVPALQEALFVGARSQARLVISHHKVMGSANHGRTQDTLRMIDAAASTQDVCLDCYPYEASSTMLDAQKAARTGNVLITWSSPHPLASGRTLKSLAQEWGIGLEEAAAKLMPGGAIYFSMSQQDVERVLSHPATMIGSDGLPHDQRPHPRLWGTFPRVLGHYSRERKLFALEAAVHKMTGLPAQRYGLTGRGLLKEGNAADLVVFDPDRIREGSTYENPTNPAIGIDAVIVNGLIAMWQGDVLNSHAGQRLRPQA